MVRRLAAPAPRAAAHGCICAGRHGRSPAQGHTHVTACQDITHGGDRSSGALAESTCLDLQQRDGLTRMVAQELVVEEPPPRLVGPAIGPRPASSSRARHEPDRRALGRKPQQLWPVCGASWDTCRDTPGHGLALPRVGVLAKKLTTGGSSRTEPSSRLLCRAVVQLRRRGRHRSAMTSSCRSWASRRERTLGRRRRTSSSCERDVLRAPATCFLIVIALDHLIRWPRTLEDAEWTPRVAPLNRGTSRALTARCP